MPGSTDCSAQTQECLQLQFEAMCVHNLSMPEVTTAHCPLTHSSGLHPLFSQPPHLIGPEGGGPIPRIGRDGSRGALVPACSGEAS